MNGHGSAEALAFALLSIRDRWHATLSDPGDAPIFIFAAGHESGSRELCQRLEPACHVSSSTEVDASLIDGLAAQLVGLAARSCPAPLASATEGREGDHEFGSVAEVVAAQIGFLRALRFSGDRDVRWGKAFVNLTGDYAIYLKLLFPRAKFVFIHRNPLHAYQRHMQMMDTGGRSPPRDPNWTAAFAEWWCRFVTSFMLWNQEVGGVITSYETVVGDNASEVEDYLGIRLSVLLSKGPENAGVRRAEARLDDATLIIERAGELGERLGYRFATAREGGSPDSASQTVGRGHAAEAHSRQSERACAILVPTIRYIEPECEQGLRDLERRGYTVWRLHGCSAIDSARNRLATQALENGFEETLWVDADLAFNADDVEQLRSHDLPIVSGIYAKKGSRALATAPIPGTASIVLGQGGNVIEILYAATGFLLVRRCVYEAIQRRFDLPVCNPRAAHRAIPFFMPMLEDWEGEMSYLAEDYAFSRRARLCGFKVMADTTIRLWHVGPYQYGFEDAGNEVKRVDTYEHFFAPPGDAAT